jgi:hypothetical protein
MRDDFAELAVLNRDGPREPAKIVREHDSLAVRHRGNVANAAAEFHVVYPVKSSVIGTERRKPLPCARIQDGPIRRKRLIKCI